ncbi:MAG: hypothetical protein QY320_12890 [Gammaproteobacteria bacterium]|nr:MAG: hypothetical protein QY320_12890 [Gammaproteobacteria bacterium]
MAKRVQDVKPARKPDAAVWFKENVAEQKKRYAAIVKEMDGLERDRQKWYTEFLRIVSTKGWNVNGDQRVVVPARNLPKKPKGKSKVVF